MQGTREKGVSRLLRFAICLLAAACLHAQTTGGTLSGAVRGPSGAVPNAMVAIQNSGTGKTQTVQADSEGHYRAANLAAGEYAVTATAPGFTKATASVTLLGGRTATLNFQLTPSLSLSSLGFSTSQTKGSVREQALLNKRSRMLQIHQKLGLITFFPLVATVVTSFRAHGRHTTAAARDLHIGLGSATAGLYIATAYYAIFAPKPKGLKRSGPTRFHVAMAWIHGPGMILTPILGAMAESQLNQGEKLHGAAKYHGDVALVTSIAYGLALLSETKPNWIPGLGHKMAALLPFRHHQGQHVRDAMAGTRLTARQRREFAALAATN